MTDLHSLSAVELLAAYRDKTLSPVEVTRAVLRHIAAWEPHLHATYALDADAALTQAEASQSRWLKGRPQGPLDGVPAMIKENIATQGVPLPLGTAASELVPAERDAPPAARLREAGAVILGKTNLSEWANIRSTRSTSGWSARGGLTRNPYALDRNTSGSSSGSAAAVAANFAAIAVGTETDGSIVSPSSINGLVGLKPTVGLVSRDGIIPISHTQDTAGPMARSVADAAALAPGRRITRASSIRSASPGRGWVSCATSSAAMTGSMR
jgi:Asp-tRNA(Asn)/Glu-tRNA(Gln) amidotransferase A subunit family amidase